MGFHCICFGVFKLFRHCYCYSWLSSKLLFCTVFLCYLVWPACCQTSDGSGRLLFVLPGEKVFQILAGLRHRTTDHVMGERENSRGTQWMVDIIKVLQWLNFAIESNVMFVIVNCLLNSDWFRKLGQLAWLSWCTFSSTWRWLHFFPRCIVYLDSSLVVIMFSLAHFVDH